jgi:hypothetical protein
MRVGPMFGLEALLGRFGVPLAPLIAEAGLPPDCFSHPDNRWPVDRLLDLVTRCGEAAKCPHLGLLLAQPVGPAALGAPLARLLSGALTVERALRGLTMNLHLNGEALVPALAISPDGACFSITPYAYHRRSTEHLEDFSLAAVTNILRFLGGPKWAPLRVTFAHRAPADRRPYDEFFRAPLCFGAPQSAVHFDPSWLPRRPRRRQRDWPHRRSFRRQGRNSTSRSLPAGRSFAGWRRASSASIRRLRPGPQPAHAQPPPRRTGHLDP